MSSWGGENRGTGGRRCGYRANYGDGRHLVAAARSVLSGNVESAGGAANEGAMKEGSAARQALAGVPVTARQVAKRSSRSWR